MRVVSVILIALGTACVSDPGPDPVSCVAAPGVICTIAGSGARATDPLDADEDGAPDVLRAQEAQFDLPVDVTFGPDGRLYISDWNGHKVRVLDFASNTVGCVAGTGVEGDACEATAEPDGSCPALAAEINHATDLAFDVSGELIVVSWHGSKLKRVDLAAGQLHPLCGAGDRRFVGDGGPCRDASGQDLVSFDLPARVTVDAAGNLFVLDQANQIVRRLGADGIVRTVAGHCPDETTFGCFAGQGYSGDGAPATSAQLSFGLGQGTDPHGGVAVDAQGNLYIADTLNQAIRRVTPGTDGAVGDGDSSEEIITTFAGGGEPGYADATGQAARFYDPRDLAFGPDGALYVADTHNNCVRRIDAAAQVTTVAGICGANPDFTGDGGDALAAHLARPYGLTIDASGNLYIADTLNGRIRVVYHR